MEAAENLAGGRGILCSLVRVGGNRAGVVWDHLPLTTRARGAPWVATGEAQLRLQERGLGRTGQAELCATAGHRTLSPSCTDALARV